MEHIFFSDGDTKKISWFVVTGNKKTEQTRDHVEIYRDIVTPEQSKYIALHVGIFWSVGTFLIKNGDSIKVMLDSKRMYDNLVQGIHPEDQFIEKRTEFIKLLIKQRGLDVSYEVIDASQNSAAPLIKHFE